ncbi:MAG: hypothetical protein ACFE9S_00860 [Candidatus Hermodarchaeota archaeon]
MSDIPCFNNSTESEIRDYIFNFDFISLQKGNYQDYIVINKILFIIDTINILKYDIRTLSELLNYNAFEGLIGEILCRNNYFTIKNFRFSDKSNYKSITAQKRYEIDIIGIYLKYVLLIDAKQWKRKDSFSALNNAADLQYRRAIALKKNPEAFSRIIQCLLNTKTNLKNRLPLLVIPMMVTLEDNSFKFNSNQIPLVSIYELNSFLQELNKNLIYFKTVKINKIIIQKKLF